MRRDALPRVRHMWKHILPDSVGESRRQSAVATILSGIRALGALESVRVGMVTGVAADAAQAIATAAFGIDTIETTCRHFYQIWNGRKRADGHEGDCGSLTCRTFDPVGHKQTKAEPEGSPSQSQKRIDRQIARLLGNGNR
jgi:hypothetical protein